MQLEKRNTLSNDIIFIDGLWGTGKSLLGPIVSGMSGVERVKVESCYEYISLLFYLEKIDQDAAVFMLKTYADESQYHNLISREVNLRWSDDTGLKNATNKLKVIKRLFCGEGDVKLEEINRDNLAFCAMSHMLMITPKLLPIAFGDRVKVIEMVRHPLYMLDHISAYLKRFESAREFTMAYYLDDVKVPWFAKEWESQFVAANPVEQAVLCMTYLYPMLIEQIQKARLSGLEVLDLSFEEAAFDTDKMLFKLHKFTGRSHFSGISSILKKQKLPRATIAKGNGHPAYGWSKRTDKSESEDYMERLAVVNNHCSKKIKNEMNHLIDWYNNAYPSSLSHYHKLL
jgi:hypothetical protein